MKTDAQLQQDVIDSAWGTPGVRNVVDQLTVAY